MTLSLTNPEEHLSMAKMVPMPLSEADWVQWNAALRVFLDAYDPRIWEIIEGTTAYPQPVPKDKDIIRLLAIQNDKQLRDVTEKEFGTFKPAAENQYKEWKKLETHALLLLWSTLGPRPREQIAGIRNIKIAHEELCDWLESTSWPKNCNLWSEWTSVRFDESQDPAEFVDGWQEALGNLQASSDEITTFVQFHMFMEAVSDVRHFSVFRDTLLTETYGTISMPTVIARFLSHVAGR